MNLAWDIISAIFLALTSESETALILQQDEIIELQEFINLRATFKPDPFHQNLISLLFQNTIKESTYSVIPTMQMSFA